MANLYYIQKRLHPILQFFSPTLLISLGLHGLLLLIPLPPEEAHKQKERPKSLKIESIKIKDLLATGKKSSFQPTSKPSSKISPTPTKIMPLRPQIRTVPALPVQEPVLEITASPTPVVIASPTPVVIASNSPTPAVTASSTPVVTASNSPAPELKSQTKEVELQSFLASSGISTDSQVTPDLFADPSKFFENLNPPKLKSDILKTTWIDGKVPTQVSFTILQNPGEFQVTELGKYGDGIVSEVKQENVTWYFNFVPTKDSTGTIIVVWKQDPSLVAPVQ